jgi:drug/metabolite transporter (DMT)-like permease
VASKLLQLTPVKIGIGFLYGALVAGAYLFIKVAGLKGGLEIFTMGCLVNFAVHAILWPRLVFEGLRDFHMVTRGISFGLTQIFIFKAQYLGQTSAALVAAVFGGVVAVAAGRFILNEKAGRLTMFAIFISFIGFLSDLSMFIKTSWAILGGLFQGGTLVISRRLMVKEKRRRQAIASGFFLGGLVGLIGLGLQRDLPLLLGVTARNALLIATIMLVVQYGYFQIVKMMDTQRSSVLLLSRVPWAFALEAIFLASSVTFSRLVSSACIVLGAAILVIEGAKIRQN